MRTERHYQSILTEKTKKRRENESRFARQKRTG